MNIDTGDAVHHKPTGEDWLVACVDGDKLYWLGWPEGRAELADCELRKKATPEDRMMWLRELAKTGRDESGARTRIARRQLQQMTYNTRK